MFKKFIKFFFFKKKLYYLQEKEKIYSELTSEVDIYNYQVYTFNKVWKYAYENIPFYILWKEKYNLPDSIERIEDLDKFPILTKKDIQLNKELIFSFKKNCKKVSTGGSTAKPVSFPIDKNESDYIYANIYFGRAWWNIQPFSKILMFWGHRHLYGYGVGAYPRAWIRLFFDYLINTKRVSVYNLTHKNLAKYIKVLLLYNPKVIIGYTSVIFKLAKYIEDNKLNIKVPNLKYIIVTAEFVSDYDINLIESIFGVPCIIEYGMGEAGVIATSYKSTRELAIFWDSFIAREDANSNLIITTLYKKVFPLINYITYDQVDVLSQYKSSVLKIGPVKGRQMQYIKIRGINKEMLELNGVLLIQSLKDYPNLFDIIIKDLHNGRIIIKVTSSEKIDLNHLKDYFFNIKQKDHASIAKDAILFEQVEKIDKSIAGKTRWLEFDDASKDK